MFWPRVVRTPRESTPMCVRAPCFDVDKFATAPPPLPDMPRKWNWTEEENRIILSNVQRHGTQWDLVAAQLPGRTADAVRNHCHRLQRLSLCSDGSTEDRKTGSAHGRSVWTAEEDRIICECMEAFGCKWRRIAAKLPGRSDSSVRNRWSRICDGPITRVLMVKPSAHAGQIGRDPLSARNDPLGAAAEQPAAYYPFGPQLDPATDFGSWQVQQHQMHQMHQLHQNMWAMQQQQLLQQHLQPVPQQCTLLPWLVKNGAVPTAATPLTTTPTPGALRPGSHFRVVPY
jgi:hypothetical protein